MTISWYLHQTHKYAETWMKSCMNMGRGIAREERGKRKVATSLAVAPLAKSFDFLGVQWKTPLFPKKLKSKDPTQ